MTRPIPWPRILIEGLVIVASVLLALAGDAWWDARQALVQEQEVLRGLTADFQVNAAQLGRAARRHEGELDFLQRTAGMSGLQLQELLAQPEEMRTFQTMLQVLASTFDPQDATLDATIASGRLDIIRDAEVREALVAWKAAVEDVAEEAGELRRIGEQLTNRVAALGGPWSLDLPTGSVFPPELLRRLRALPPLTPETLRVLSGDEEVHRLLRARQLTAMFYHWMLTDLAGRVNRVLGLIEGNLR